MVLARALSGGLMIPTTDEPSVLVMLATLRATADVALVEEGEGFLASVLWMPGYVPAARLLPGLADRPYGGVVYHAAMMATTGFCGEGYFEWRLGPGGVVVATTPAG